MTKVISQQVEQILKASQHWSNDNLESIQFHRLEGLLENAVFNQRLLAHLQSYQTVYESLTRSLICGFEIEFYLKPEALAGLEKKIAQCLPHTQMLLVDTQQVHKTNGQHFYLMHENTGAPPLGYESYEIVSPKLDARFLPYYLSTLFAQLQAFHALDNDSIGFHLHISTVDKSPLSPIALIYFLDEAGAFAWESREFTRDIVQQFFDYRPQDWEVIYRQIARKCYNLNLLHFNEHNHIELRSIGGKHYITQSQKLLDAAMNALLAFEKTATTPHSEVAEKIIQKYALNHSVVQTSELSYQDLLALNPEHIWQGNG